MGDSKAPLDQFECVKLVQEGRSRVLIRREVIGVFNALDERPKARLLAIASMWCDPARVLTIEQFNGNETRAQKGPINRMLCAFKARRVRLYGFVRRLEGYRTFVIVDCDDSKKSDQANPRILASAKKRVIAFEESYGDGYE